jgi:hypothetical protein
MTRASGGPGPSSTTARIVWLMSRGYHTAFHGTFIAGWCFRGGFT